MYFRHSWTQENICHLHVLSLKLAVLGLGGCQDPRDTDLSLEELASLSNEVYPSTESVIVSDCSANPFHMSGDVDFFLLRDQEKSKSRSVSIQDQGLPQLFLPFPSSSQISEEHFPPSNPQACPS